MIYIYFKHIVFNEIAKSVYQALREIGYEVCLTDKLIKDSTNIFIIFGANDFLEFLPNRYIIYQLEQTNISENNNKKNLPEKYIHIMSKALQVWDFSMENIRYLERTYNLRNLKYVPILYSSALQTITNFNDNKPIDILFIGGLNKRREAIIRKLQLVKNLSIEVGSYNLWDQKRDYILNRSKIVLNINYYDNSVLETARLSYLIANKAFVISEPGRDKLLQENMKGLVVFSKYNDLVDTCLNYLKNPENCFKIAQDGYNNFKKMKYNGVIPLEKLQNEEKKILKNNKKKKKKQLDIYIPKEIKKASTETLTDGNYKLKIPQINDDELPNISIITPTGNRRNLFSIAIRNYQSFIYPKNKMEWIILDDGNESISDLIPKDKTIRYIKMDCGEHRLPIGCKRNKAIEYANNDYILFMDDDDYYSPESILARIKFLVNSDIECVGCSSVGCYNLLTEKSVLAEDSNNLLCEASLAFTKKFWEERKFDDGDLNNESKYFLQYRQEKLLDIPFQFIMIAFNHKNNLTGSLRNYDKIDYSKDYTNLYESFDVITQIFIKDLKKVINKDFIEKEETINNEIPEKMSYTFKLPTC